MFLSFILCFILCLCFVFGCDNEFECSGVRTCFEGSCVSYVGPRRLSLSSFCVGCASELSLYYGTFYLSSVNILYEYDSLPGYCVLGFESFGEVDGVDIATYYSLTRNNLIRIDDGFALCIIKAQARL